MMYIINILTFHNTLNKRSGRKISLMLWRKIAVYLKSLLENATLKFNYYVLSVLLYGSQCRTVSSKMKSLKAIEILFHGRILRIP